MPTIHEENEALNAFFDFTTAGQPDLESLLEQDLVQRQAQSRASLPPPDSLEESIAHLACKSNDNTEGLEAADYARPEDWIPRFVKPDTACDYCRTKHLDCYLNFGKVSCTACENLFRPCSFAKVSDVSAPAPCHSSKTGYVDTLHHVQEDVCQERGALTGLRPLRSKAASSGSVTGSANVKKSANRFSRAAVKVLRDWLASHAQTPYPSEDEKMQLERETGLKSSQISTWLANARRRTKVGRASESRNPSPGPRGSSAAINMPSPANVSTWSELNPIERWQHSPPENEPASITDISNAVAESDMLDEDPRLSRPLGYQGQTSSSGSVLSARRAPSTTSLETSTSMSANSSAAWSGSHDSYGSFGSFGSGLQGKKDRRRRRKAARPLPRNTSDTKKRSFQCTFCTDRFVSKYDWSRHEKSLHLSLEKWFCAPQGPVTTDAATGLKTCAYCQESDPSAEHIEQHSRAACDEKSIEARTFFRKDHLRQHLRLVHGCELRPHMDAWKASVREINSRCGFCDQRFTFWQDRVDHLAAHFRDGAEMRNWKGCRGLDPEVAASVLNAMPPYLIGWESNTPDPFSATRSPDGFFSNDRQSRRGSTAAQLQTEDEASVWELLPLSLSQYATAQWEKGISITDEMLQNQARIVAYGCEDSWNQTEADNPEWLDLFKKAAVLGYIPKTVGGRGVNVPDDLELYGDLGLRVPFCVQLERGVAAAAVEPPTSVGVPDNSSSNAKTAMDTSKPITSNSAHEAKGQGRKLTLEEFRARRAMAHSNLVLPAERARMFSTLTGPKCPSGRLGPVIDSEHYAALVRAAFSDPFSMNTPNQSSRMRSPSETAMGDADMGMADQDHVGASGWDVSHGAVDGSTTTPLQPTLAPGQGTFAGTMPVTTAQMIGAFSAGTLMNHSAAPGVGGTQTAVSGDYNVNGLPTAHGPPPASTTFADATATTAFGLPLANNMQDTIDMVDDFDFDSINFGDLSGQGNGFPVADIDFDLDVDIDMLGLSNGHCLG